MFSLHVAVYLFLSISIVRRRAGSDARARSANVSGSSSRRSSINQLMSAVRRWSTPNISPLAKKLKELLKQLDKAAPSVGPGGKASRRMSASVEKSVVQKIHDELFANPEVSNYADMTDVHIFLQWYEAVEWFRP
ncbi:hypothetical protein SARC_09178 [Sphaeroforma arctica JP610]|uniref:Uncharacterized protein n=1 Tax=Sphaeroforma arctica JP610 TaxID=667725 RepID=A0A0L0FNJ2_9EUKA|nr:hypothetical protein SARC_09178 [Sphaeroforma arctica JP610]KNC78390.1 hypothetical protein SARC_09178 [Sphaeroforma arctica JP610]|eukprot:XP_014152292.1 hypothetical protein SARC_09178 [Sphaeroforma arctica JP610]